MKQNFVSKLSDGCDDPGTCGRGGIAPACTKGRRGAGGGSPFLGVTSVCLCDGEGESRPNVDEIIHKGSDWRLNRCRCNLLKAACLALPCFRVPGSFTLFSTSLLKDSAGFCDALLAQQARGSARSSDSHFPGGLALNLGN